MKLKVGKLKICSGALVFSMVLQLCFFCPCTYAAGSIDDLCEAVETGELDKVSSILEGGVDPNQFNERGKTPLHLAVKWDHKDCVGLLIEKGANPNEGDGFYNQTPLHLAAMMGYEACLGLLLEKGANLDQVDNRAETPLHVAASNGRVACVKLLLEKGANPNQGNGYNITPLHWATQEGYVDCVRLLLENGANPNSQDKGGRTPLNLCKNPEIKVLLKAHGGEKTGLLKRLAKKFDT